jgi:subtilisin family serine protease
MRVLIATAAAVLSGAAGAPSGGQPIVVAVVDSGVDPSVPGLVAGYNAVDGSSDTRDGFGHGTGVAQVAPLASPPVPSAGSCR